MSDVQPNSDSYRTITAPSRAERKIMGSRFIGYAYPVATPEEFQEHLSGLKTKYYDATHHCYAYRVGFDGSGFRYSDDGEPNGTAGKRILGSIDRFELTNTGIVVIRYFGGTKLGVGGLSRAYSEGADAALEATTHKTMYIKHELKLVFPYDATSSIHHDIETYEAQILDRQYGNDVVYIISIRESHIAPFTREVTEHTNRTTVISRTSSKEM